eukprot:g1895.t1
MLRARFCLPPALLLLATDGSAAVTVGFDPNLRAADFGAGRLHAALTRAGIDASVPERKIGDENHDIVLGLMHAAPELVSGSYKIVFTNGSLVLAGQDDAGAMYAALDLAERLDNAVDQSWSEFVSSLPLPLESTPRFAYRALKFNLPWSAYRPGNATAANYVLCRNLTFWESFLDMMADNRYNVITLWALHPWAYMVTPQNFSKAASFGDTAYWGGPEDGSETEADWKAFWKGLFKMAKDRAIDPYIIDWNIFLSEGYKAGYDSKAITDHDGSGGDGTSNPTADQYQREVITQVVNEYADLAGIGVTLGERMQNLGEKSTNLTAQVTWIENTVLAALQQANRPVNLIYRAALDNKAPTTVRGSIERFVAACKASGRVIQVWVQLKFNWSHGHSTPILVHAHGGGTGDGYWKPPSDDYKMVWMIRNEDFFFLRWGGSNSIRAHIARNGGSFVGGYITGSEAHIPAVDYATTPGSPTRTWEYDFERQWLYYLEWGRLLYDPSTPDDVFAAAYTKRAQLQTLAHGQAMLAAMHNASIMPLRTASFVYNTWDFTLHAEGFVAAVSNADKSKQNPKGFISIETLVACKTLDPTLQSVSDFVKHGAPANTSIRSPLDLADELHGASELALELIDSVPDTVSVAAEKFDVRTWAHLGRYFALKLQAAVSLATYRSKGGSGHKEDAVSKLTAASSEWASVVNITSMHLGQPSLGGKIFLLDFGEGYKKPGTFSWAEMAPYVARDLAIAENATAPL